MPIHQSVHPLIHLSKWKNSDPTVWIFMKFHMKGFFKNLSKFKLKSDMNNGYFT